MNEFGPRPEMPKVENLDAYEKEKLVNTLKDLEFTLELGRNALKMLENADKNGIKLDRKTNFSGLRVPGGLAGPGGVLSNGLQEIQGMFIGAQKEVAAKLTEKQALTGVKLEEGHVI